METKLELEIMFFDNNGDRISTSLFPLLINENANILRFGNILSLFDTEKKSVAGFALKLIKRIDGRRVE